LEFGRHISQCHQRWRVAPPVHAGASDFIGKALPMWFISWGLLFVWFILKFFLHKGGYVHILLIAAISVMVIQLLAYRNMRYHKRSAADSDKL
jgi:hypothetical protein